MARPKNRFTRGDVATAMDAATKANAYGVVLHSDSRDIEIRLREYEHGPKRVTRQFKVEDPESEPEDDFDMSEAFE